MKDLPRYIPTDAIIARYAQGIARKYAIRSTALFIISAALALAVIVISVVNSYEWIFATILITILVGLSIFCLLYALTSKETWTTDDNLAVAVSNEGVVLPLTGLILWTEITSIKITDSNLFTITKAFKDWTFGSTDQSITIYVTAIESVLLRADPKAKFGLVADLTGTKRGFVGGLGSGMASPTFTEMTNVVRQYASQRGITVTRG